MNRNNPSSKIGLILDKSKLNMHNSHKFPPLLVNKPLCLESHTETVIGIRIKKLEEKPKHTQIVKSHIISFLLIKWAGLCSLHWSLAFYLSHHFIIITTIIMISCWVILFLLLTTSRPLMIKIISSHIPRACVRYRKAVELWSFIVIHFTVY